MPRTLEEVCRDTGKDLDHVERLRYASVSAPRAA